MTFINPWTADWEGCRTEWLGRRDGSIIGCLYTNRAGHARFGHFWIAGKNWAASGF